MWLHNAEGDACPLILRNLALQIFSSVCCWFADTVNGQKFYEIIDALAASLSLVELCKNLFKQGEQALSMRITQMTDHEAELIINLARYEHDTPDYVKEHWFQIALHPFLPLTSGMEMQNGLIEA